MSASRTRAIQFCACLFALADTAHAQTGAPASPSPRQERAYESLAGPGNLPLGALPGAEIGEGRAAGGEVILEGTEENQVATAAIGWKRGSSQYRMKFSSPLSKQTKEATPLSLEDGLPTAATFEVNISNLIWANATEDDLQEFARLCQAELKKPRCDIGDLPAAARAEARRLLRFDDTPMYVGATATLSRRGFDFLDAALHEQSRSATDFSLGARFGAFNETFGFSFLTFGYEERHKAAGNEQTICRPLANTDALTCEDHVLGEPSKRTGSVLGIELRRFIGRVVGIAPALRYDVKADTATVSVPVYFLRNRAGGLTGGVRAAWRSDTESVSVSIFIGAALALVP